jgi:hypothetical protein
MLAMGHGLKALVTTQLKYYSCILQPLFKAQGITIGSPAYNRILKARVIRDSVKWAFLAQEGLRRMLAWRLGKTLVMNRSYRIVKVVGYYHHMK